MSSSGIADSLCDHDRTYCTAFCNCGKLSLWPLLSPGLRAKMTEGFQPCPWLIPEDIPRGRLHPLAGTDSFGCGWGELDPAASPIQMGTLHQGSRKNQRPAFPCNSLDSLAFFTMWQSYICDYKKSREISCAIIKM
jgi:hypothetical protein